LILQVYIFLFQSRHGVFYGGLKIDPAGSEQLHVGSVLGFGTDELFKSDPDLQIFKLVLLPRSKAGYCEFETMEVYQPNINFEYFQIT